MVTELRHIHFLNRVIYSCEKYEQYKVVYKWVKNLTDTNFFEGNINWEILVNDALLNKLNEFRDERLERYREKNPEDRWS